MVDEVQPSEGPPAAAPWVLPGDVASPTRPGFTAAALARPGRRGPLSIPPVALGWILAATAVAGTLANLIPIGPDGTALPALAAVVIALIVLEFALARLDRDQLRAAGLPTAAAAWVILHPVIYLAIRTFRLRRVGIRAGGPLIMASIALGVNLCVLALGVVLLVVVSSR